MQRHYTTDWAIDIIQKSGKMKRGDMNKEERCQGHR